MVRGMVQFSEEREVMSNFEVHVSMREFSEGVYLTFRTVKSGVPLIITEIFAGSHAALAAVEEGETILTC